MPPWTRTRICSRLIVLVKPAYSVSLGNHGQGSLFQSLVTDGKNVAFMTKTCYISLLELAFEIGVVLYFKRGNN